MRSAILLLIISAFGFAQQPPQDQYREARRLYYGGTDGNKAEYEAADRMFRQLYSKTPNDPRVKAYYGSLRLLEASHTWALWKKNSLSKEGIQLLDAAVEASPNDLEVRFVRAATTYELPAFFHRREQSRQDFELLAAHAVDAARSGALEPRLAAACFYYRAEFLKQDGKSAEAIALWKQAAELAPGSRAARESAAELNGHS